MTTVMMLMDEAEDFEKAAIIAAVVAGPDHALHVVLSIVLPFYFASWPPVIRSLGYGLHIEDARRTNVEIHRGRWYQSTWGPYGLPPRGASLHVFPANHSCQHRHDLISVIRSCTSGLFMYAFRRSQHNSFCPAWVSSSCHLTRRVLAKLNKRLRYPV